MSNGREVGVLAGRRCGRRREHLGGPRAWNEVAATVADDGEGPADARTLAYCALFGASRR
jgi:hypothetical protein